MTRIVFLHGSNDLYGASRVLVGDVKIVVGLGADVRVVLPYDGPLSQSLAEAGAQVHVRPLRVLRRVRPASAVEWPLLLPVSTHRDEIVVLWTLGLLPYLPSLVIRRRAVIVSVHELLPGQAGSALARLANLSTAPIMVNSSATYRWMLAHGGVPNRVCAVYPAAPPYSACPSRRWDNRLKVLVAGRVGGWKGHLEAVDAVQKLRDWGHDVELTLAGAPFPGQEVHLERLLERIRGRGWVRYIGQVADIRDALCHHDVLLVASAAPEPFGLVAVEAWAAGRRVVAPDEGGAAEAGRMVDGVMYRPRDTAAMAKALELVATEPALRAPPREEAPVSALCTTARRREAWRLTLSRTANPV